jgi:hypothetical protein
MSLDPRLSALFDDLEQQAAGLELAERDRELAEQRRAEYATVDLVSRLHASVGSHVLLAAPVLGALEGLLGRVGVGWLLLETDSQGTGTEWLVRTAALTSVRGLSGRAVPAEVRSVTARLGLGSALRQVVASGREAVLHLTDGRVVRGVPGRVGADFLEVRVVDGPAYAEVVPFNALVALQVAP